MPEDTPKTAETEAVQDYQPPPSVVTLYDNDGRAHFTANDSKFAVDGLAHGTLTSEPPSSGEQNTEEVPGGSEPRSAGENQESGSTDGNEGSGDGSADPSGSRRGRRTGSA